MSATMARQGGRVQLEQSDRCLALNMVEMAKGEFSHSAAEAMYFLIKKPPAEPREDKRREEKRREEPGCSLSWQWKDECSNRVTPGYALSKPHCQMPFIAPMALEWNRRHEWHAKGTSAPPPNGYRHMTPEPMPQLPKMPHSPTGKISGQQYTQIVNVPARYVYSHTSHFCAALFTFDAAAQDRQHDTDFDPDMPNDEGTSTDNYTICCVIMPLTSVLMTRAAYWAKLQVITRIDWKAQDFRDYYSFWYILLMNNVVIKKKVYENDWKAAKTMWMI